MTREELLAAGEAADRWPAGYGGSWIVAPGVYVSDERTAAERLQREPDLWAFG